jgi:hypothetical protein
MVDVKRLAAVDMHGRVGSARRRRIVRLEFIVSVVGCLALGVLALVAGSGWEVAVGVWLCGVGLNYVPLAIYARQLSRPGALDRELSGADRPHEARRGGKQQLWIMVPFALVIAAVRGAARTART